MSQTNIVLYRIFTLCGFSLKYRHLCKEMPRIYLGLCITYLSLMSSNEDRSEEGNLSHPIFRLIITSTDNAAMDKQVNVFEKGCIIFSIPCVNR